MQSAWSMLFETPPLRTDVPAPHLPATSSSAPAPATWHTRGGSRGSGSGAPRGRGGAASRGRGGGGRAPASRGPGIDDDDDDDDTSSDDSESCASGHTSGAKKPKRTPRILQEIQEMLPPRVRELMKQPLDTPEQIAAWIAARKKSFPTAANVQKKETEQQEALARGELPSAARRTFQAHERGGRGGRGQARGGARGGGFSIAPRRTADDASSSSSGSSYGSGSSSSTSATDSTITHTADAADADDAPAEERNAVAAARALAAADDANHVGGGGARHIVCTYFLQNRCRNGTMCRFSHDESARAEHALKRQQLRDGGNGDGDDAHAGKRTRDGLCIPRPAPSLLRKLLANEVHREFSAIFQCFRQLVSRDFFTAGAGNATNVDETASTSDV